MQGPRHPQHCSKPIITSISCRRAATSWSCRGPWHGRGATIGALSTNFSTMRTATSEYPDSLAEEESIDKRDRLKLLTAALATQVMLGAISRSLYNRGQNTLDRTVTFAKGNYEYAANNIRIHAVIPRHAMGQEPVSGRNPDRHETMECLVRPAYPARENQKRPSA